MEGECISCEVSGVDRGEPKTREPRLTLHDPDHPHDVLRPAKMPAGYASLQAITRSIRRRRRPDRLWHHVGSVVTGLASTTRRSYRKLVKPRPRTLAVGCRPRPRYRESLRLRELAVSHRGVCAANPHHCRAGIKARVAPRLPQPREGIPLNRRQQPLTNADVSLRTAFADTSNKTMV